VATQTYGTVTHMPPELLSEGRLSKAADVCEPSSAFGLPDNLSLKGRADALDRSFIVRFEARSASYPATITSSCSMALPPRRGELRKGG